VGLTRASELCREEQLQLPVLIRFAISIAKHPRLQCPVSFPSPPLPSSRPSRLSSFEQNLPFLPSKRRAAIAQPIQRQATPGRLSGPTSSPGRVKKCQTGSGAPSASYPMGVGGGGISQWVKRLGREANHPPPISAELKKACIYYPTHILGIVLSYARRQVYL
jgi:hypothetical protein